MAVYGDSPYSSDDIPQLIGIKTHVGGYFFDAFLKVDHSRKLTITEHPVEEGANIADHAFVEPLSLSMEIGMSDVCTSFVNGQFANRYTRSVSAYGVLEKLQDDRIPISVHTRLRTYHNMLIETITAPDDYTTFSGLRVTIGLREVIVVKTATAALPNRTSAAPQKTGETNKGTVQPVNISSGTNKAVSSVGGSGSEYKSTAKKFADALFGGK